MESNFQREAIASAVTKAVAQAGGAPQAALASGVRGCVAPPIGEVGVAAAIESLEIRRSPQEDSNAFISMSCRAAMSARYSSSEAFTASSFSL